VQPFSTSDAIALSNHNAQEKAVLLTIRPPERQDYPGICQLFAEGDAFHASALPDRFRSMHPARSEVFFKDVLTSTEHHLFVAEIEQRLVGLIEFRVIAVADHSPVVARHFVAIDSLIVTDGYQRRGMGRRLMHAVEQWSADHSIATIELNVYAFNHPAIRLYEELGYHVLSQRLEKKLDW